jgi:hypothetical protein
MASKQITRSFGFAQPATALSEAERQLKEGKNFSRNLLIDASL